MVCSRSLKFTLGGLIGPTGTSKVPRHARTCSSGGGSSVCREFEDGIRI